MKRILFVLAALLGVLELRADGESYLYWMIEENAATSLGKTSLDDYTARIYGVVQVGETGDLLNLYDNPGSASFGKEVGAGDLHNVGVYAGWGSDKAYSSFYVEILNGLNVLGRSTSVEAVGSTMEFSATAPTLVAKFGDFTPTPVPEPCSGLLMVFGLAAFALRRPRRA